MSEAYVFRDWEIRPEMLEALDRYIHKGYRPGGFLTSVLAHDLMEACQRADDINIRNLPAYAAYMYNEMPSASHGSYEIVDAWVANIDEVRTRTSSIGGLNVTP